LLYFEIVTTAALAVGLLVVNIVEAGRGRETGRQRGGRRICRDKPLDADRDRSCISFPTSLIDAMARNDVLQVVVFAVLFRHGGDRRRRGRQAGAAICCDSVTQVMFKFAGIIMKFAPFGVGAAIAVTVEPSGRRRALLAGKAGAHALLAR